jgi:hypothetical protein
VVRRNVLLSTFAAATAAPTLRDLTNRLLAQVDALTGTARTDLLDALTDADRVLFLASNLDQQRLRFHILTGRTDLLQLLHDRLDAALNP